MERKLRTVSRRRPRSRESRRSASNFRSVGVEPHEHLRPLAPAGRLDVRGKWRGSFVPSHGDDPAQGNHGVPPRTSDLSALNLTSTSGLSRQPDGSMFAANGEEASYRLTATTPLKGITAFRLELPICRR